MTRADVESHCTEDDCWIILDGRVFDVTEFLDYHPGSKSLILDFAGRDATQAFRKVHPYVNYAEVLAHEQVGAVEDCAVASPAVCKKTGDFMHKK